MSNAELHSRSALAGYQPAAVSAARVTIVGLGALGQNIVQNLALIGVGHLMLVDCDFFEDHNATRSPFYPSFTEQKTYGLRKAPTVARHAYLASTAEHPDVRHADGTLQQLGDACIRSADVVVAAVDNVDTRGWIAERARLYGKPMVEGGFSGPEFNYGVFSGKTGTNCYRCFNPLGESSMPCTLYALQRERAGIIPAIQTTAAVLGGLMSEQVMNAIHGSDDAEGLRFYGNVRAVRLTEGRLEVAQRCPGVHVPLEVRRLLPGEPPLTTLADLVAAMRSRDVRGWMVFPDAVAESVPCTSCGRGCEVRSVQAAWLLAPRCQECDGPWPLSGRKSPAFLRMIEIGSELDQATGSMSLEDLGIRPGGCVVIGEAGEADPGPDYLLEIPGDGPAGFTRIADADVPPDHRAAIRFAPSA